MNIHSACICRKALREMYTLSNLYSFSQRHLEVFMLLGYTLAVKRVVPR